jgi:hypothetical protein
MIRAGGRLPILCQGSGQRRNRIPSSTGSNAHPESGEKSYPVRPGWLVMTSPEYYPYGRRVCCEWPAGALRPLNCRHRSERTKQVFHDEPPPARGNGRR